MTTPASSQPGQPTFYEAIGGDETFSRIVRGFYAQVREDELIGPLYPQDDWEGAEQRLKWFLAQYWGGPQTFSAQRGHPRLRMRHATYSIGTEEAQRWLDMMHNSLDRIEEETIPPAYRAALWEHMERVAAMLINRAP